MTGTSPRRVNGMGAALSFAIACALIAIGCSQTNPLYCEDDSWCSDPARPFCDVNGASEASGFVENTCVDNLGDTPDPNCEPTGDEVCNGRDDDCDGTTDEGYQVGESCSVGVGGCARTGMLVCSADGDTVCNAVAGEPSAELCDGIDNDCDGFEDEDWPTLDESCSTGIGACESAGVIACTSNGLAAACDAVPGSPAIDEVCGNTIDETCDGSLVDGCDCEPGSTPPQACGPESDVGACVRGEQSCLPDGTWGACDGAVWPTAESCNGIDDDCNGQTDEGFGISGTCTEGVGLCADEGRLVCRADGSGTECNATPGQPQVESCDGFDNDCDGDTDEAWPTLGVACTAGLGACESTGTTVCTADGSGAVCDAVPGQPATEICGNNVDENCDGSLVLGCDCNPGATQPCGPNSDLGLCQAGTETCGSDGKWGNCEGAVFPAAERCSGEDENCNGMTDDGFNVGASCIVGVGACERTGNTVCSADGTGTVCDEVPGPSSNESCDGVDNDCDGDTDENWPTLGSSCSVGVGACQDIGNIVCTANGNGAQCDATPGTPAAQDICGNNIDENCDGNLFDGCPCTPGQSGPCGPDNETGICQFGSRTCTQSGQWGACEDEVMPATELCNGLDDDCNSVTDDGFDVGAVCSVGVGACARTGNLICTADGTGNVCDEQPGAPSLETCNGVDDDCDGTPDNGIEPDCVNADVLRVCSGGVLADVSCAAQDKTCFDDDCAGECAAGAYQCNSAGNSEVCDGTGTWRADDTCDTPDQLCDAASGRCVENPPLIVGRGDATGGVGRSIFDGDFLATRILVTDDVVIRAIGVRTSANSNGGRAYLAVYDEVSSNGQPVPGQLLAFTSRVSLATNVANERAPTANNVQLRAGNHYWVAAKFQEVSGEAVQIYRFTSSERYRQSAAVWSDPLPSTFPASSDSAGELGIYVRVQRF